MAPILSYSDLIELIYHIDIPKEHRNYTDAYILWSLEDSFFQAPLIESI